MIETLRYLWRRKVRTALTILAVAVGIFAVTAVGGIAEELESTIQAVEQDALSRISVWSVASPVSDATVRQIRRIDGVAGVVISLYGSLEVPQEAVIQISLNPPQFFGVRSDIPGLEYEPPMPDVVLWDGRLPEPGSRTETVVTWALAESEGVGVGDTLMIRERPFEVVGIWADTPAATGRTASIAYEAAEDLLGNNRVMPLISVVPSSGIDPEDLVTRIKEELPDVVAMSPNEVVRQARQQVMIFSAVVGASGVLSLLIGTFTIVNTMVVSVQERRREIGLKKALGAEDAHILREVVAEAAFIAGLGGVIGVSAGAGVGTLANTLLSTDLGMSIFRLSPRLGLGVIIFSVLMGVVAGLYPALRAARLDPVVALQGGAGGSAALVGRGLRGLLRRVRKSSRSILTVGGIAVGVFALVLLGSLAEALNTYLGDATAGSGDLLIVSSETMASRVTRASARAIRGLPGVEEVIFSSQADLAINFSGDENDEGESQQVWAFESDSGDMGVAMLVTNHIAEGRRWGANAEREIVLGAGLAEAQGVHVGDIVWVNDRTFEVVGIWNRIAFDVLGHDTAAFLTVDGLRRALGHEAGLALSVRAVSPDAAEALTETIPAEFPGFTASTIGEVLGTVQRAFSGLIAVMGAIFSIAVFVGGVSVVNTMVIAVNEWTREIGLKKAIGAEDADILAEVLMEAAKLGTLGGILGVLVAWGASVAINPIIKAAVGLDILHVSVRLAVGAVIFSLLLGTISGLLPARRAARLDPVIALHQD